MMTAVLIQQVRHLLIMEVLQVQAMTAAVHHQTPVVLSMVSEVEIVAVVDQVEIIKRHSE